jgi:hypothetical protein
MWQPSTAIIINDGDSRGAGRARDLIVAPLPELEVAEVNLSPSWSSSLQVVDRRNQ